jgi:DNA-directed RNA polymerase beta subunit
LEPPEEGRRRRRRRRRRLGEMERDAMLAHGLSQTVNERLFISSDRSEGYVCNKCGLMVSCFKKM